MPLRSLIRRPRTDDAPLGSHLDTRSAPEPEANHIIAARTEFSNVFGDLAKAKRNWQLIAFAVTALLSVVTVSYVRLASSSRVVPYVVQVDKFDQVLAVGTAEQMAAPNQRLVASQLAQFIRAVRTVLPAAAASGQADMIRRGYAFVEPEAAGVLNDYFGNSRNDPRVLGARLTRQVEVTGILRVPNSDVWRLQWNEVEHPTQQGGPARSTAWEGYATVKIVPPTTTETIQDNPLGVYLTTINWTQVGEKTLDSPDTTHDSTAIPSTISHDSGDSR
jgi:type IV secretory pathway TrbF-like protein